MLQGRPRHRSVIVVHGLVAIVANFIQHITVEDDLNPSESFASDRFMDMNFTCKVPFPILRNRIVLEDIHLECRNDSRRAARLYL